MKHGTSKLKIRKCLKKNVKFLRDWDVKNNVCLIKRMMQATVSEDEFLNNNIMNKKEDKPKESFNKTKNETIADSKVSKKEQIEKPKNDSFQK
jgi:hypothetical protein